MKAVQGPRFDHRPLRQTMAWSDFLLPTPDAVETAAARAPVLTGFHDVDLLMGGLSAGTLTAIAGRPGLGSSTLLLDIVRNNAITLGRSTALFILDRTGIDVSTQILAAEAKLPIRNIRDGKLTLREGQRVARTFQQTCDQPLYINSTPRPVLSDLIANIRELHANRAIEFVAVDPISMIDARQHGAAANREIEISEIVRELKTLALDLDIPVAITAEVRRTALHRKRRLPKLSDIRESDTLAQTADNVIFIYRPDHDTRDHPRAGEADLLIRKNRSGRTAIVTVGHQLHAGRFVDLPQFHI